MIWFKRRDCDIGSLTDRSQLDQIERICIVHFAFVFWTMQEMKRGSSGEFVHLNIAYHDDNERKQIYFERIAMIYVINGFFLSSFVHREICHAVAISVENRIIFGLQHDHCLPKTTLICIDSAYITWKVTHSTYHFRLNIWIVWPMNVINEKHWYRIGYISRIKQAFAVNMCICDWRDKH